MSVGEITGEQLEEDLDLEQGMPLRINYDLKQRKNMNIDINNKYNPYLDFDLYDTKKDFHKISYNEETNNYSPINEINTVTPQKNSYMFNNFSFYLYNTSAKKNLCLSPFNLLQILAPLYRGSKGQTHDEFRKLFNFIDKNTLFDDVKRISMNYKKLKNINYYNTIALPNNQIINPSFVRFSDVLTAIVTYDPNNIKVNIINQEIYENTNIKDNLEMKYFSNRCSLMLINTFSVSFTSQYPTYRFSDKFYYPQGVKLINYLCLKNVTLPFYEDNNIKYLEIIGLNRLSLCILASNNNSLPHLHNDIYKYITTQAQKKEFSTVIIPEINQLSKFDTCKVLKSMQLDTLFNSMDISDICPIPKHLKVSNAFHTCQIKSNNNKSKREFVKTIGASKTSYVVNHPFVYFIRDTEEDMVLLIGNYLL